MKEDSIHSGRVQKAPENFLTQSGVKEVFAEGKKAAVISFAMPLQLRLQVPLPPWPWHRATQCPSRAAIPIS